MIWHELYRALPHREGGGGCPRQEFRRQLCFVRRNHELIADLFLVKTGQDHDLAATQRLLERRARRRNSKHPIVTFSKLLQREQSKKAAPDNSLIALSACAAPSPQSSSDRSEAKWRACPAPVEENLLF
ncbi:MAG TPA: hypothetical protein VF126_17220 [Acidobacteriaceae bacterium]